MKNSRHDHMQNIIRGIVLNPIQESESGAQYHLLFFFFFFRIRTLKAKYESSVPDQVLGEGTPCISVWVYVLSCSVMSDSYDPMTVAHQALCPWDSPGKNTRAGCHFLLQGIFLTQELNPHLLCFLHWQVHCLPLCHLARPLHAQKYIQMCYFVIFRQDFSKDLSKRQIFYGLFN